MANLIRKRAGIIFSRRRIILLLFFSSLFLLYALPDSWAAIPRYLNYQGKLSSSSGEALNGTYAMTFRIYDSQTGGSNLWSETQSVSVENGVFNAVLGTVTALNLNFDQEYWFSIQVGSDTEMSPRQRLAASAYTLNADKLDSLDSTQFLRSDEADTTSGAITFTYADGAPIVITPSSAPDADTKMIDVQDEDGTTKFSVDAEGDIAVGGNLAVTGTISGTTTASGTTNNTFTIDSDNAGTTPADGAGMIIDAGTGTDASITWDATNSRLKINKPVNINSAYTLPSADGSAGTYLKTDGAGTLSWASVSVSGYVPYTGATSDLNLGSHTLTATTLTDGTASLSAGALTGATNLTATGTVALGASGTVTLGTTGNTYTMPTTAGTSGYYLKSNGAGTAASWADMGLSSYVPYTGATTAVDLGTKDLTTTGTVTAGTFTGDGSDLTGVDTAVGNEVTNVTDTTLVRSGAGSAADPYTLGLNLAKANTWTGVPTFSASVTADSGWAKGSIFSPSLTASTANDVLTALYIDPTFTDTGAAGASREGVYFTESLTADDRKISGYYSDLSIGGSAVGLLAYRFADGVYNKIDVTAESAGNILDLACARGTGVYNKLSVSGTNSLVAGTYNEMSVSGTNAHAYGTENVITVTGSSLTNEALRVWGEHHKIVASGATTGARQIYGAEYRMCPTSSDQIYGVNISDEMSSEVSNDPSQFQVGLYVDWQIQGTGDTLADTNSNKWAIYTKPTTQEYNKVYFGDDVYVGGVKTAPAMTFDDAGQITIGNASTAGTLKLADASANYVTIQPQSITTDYTLTLPVDDGTANQFLQTDGAGALTWATVVTSETGDISSVTAGSGLTGGGDSGDVTLNVGAGTGISVAADAVAVDTAVVATTNNTLTMSGKTLTSPTINTALTLNGATSGSTALQASATASGTLTLPAATDTLVGKATTDTLTNKTLTSPTIGTSPTAAGATWTDLGSVTTCDINGGSIDAAIIGANSAAAGTFTTGRFNNNIGVNIAAATDAGVTINLTGVTGSIYGVNDAITLSGDNQGAIGYISTISTGGGTASTGARVITGNQSTLTVNTTSTNDQSVLGYGTNNQVTVSKDAASGVAVNGQAIADSNTTNQTLYGGLLKAQPDSAGDTAFGLYVAQNSDTPPTINDPSAAQGGIVAAWDSPGTDANYFKWTIYNSSDPTYPSAKVFLGADNAKTYWGTGDETGTTLQKDASICFDGDSLNIKANEITATDDIELQSDTYCTTGVLQVGANATGGTLKIADGSANYVSISAPSIGSDIALTLPSTAGTLALTSQVLSPGGSDTQVQFNDGGSAFGGDAGFVYNKTTDTATLGTLNLTNALGVAYGGTGSTNGSITGTGTLTFTAGGAGKVALKPTTDSATAIELQKANGTAVLTVFTDAGAGAAGIGVTGALGVRVTDGEFTLANLSDAGLRVNGTYADIYNDSGGILLSPTSANVGISTATPNRKLDILDADNPQLRLTHTDDTKYTDFQTDTNGDLTITAQGGDVSLGSANLSTTGNLAIDTNIFKVDTSSDILAINGNTDSNSRFVINESTKQNGLYLDYNMSTQPADGSIGQTFTGINSDMALTYTGKNYYYLGPLNFVLTDSRTINASQAVGLDFLAGVRGSVDRTGFTISSNAVAAAWHHLIGGIFYTTDAGTYQISNNLTVANADVKSNLCGLGTVDQNLTYTLNATGKTLTYNKYGFFHFQSDNPTLTAGILNHNHYGAYCNQAYAGAADATATGYAFYGNTSGYDTNWCFYNAAGNNFLGVNNAKSYFGTSSSASIYYDGTNLVVNPREAASGILAVNSDVVRVSTAKTPASAGATGTAGDICWDSSYVYVCVATNTWKRAALSTW